MGNYNKRHGDKLATNTNLTIKIIGVLIVVIMSLIGFGVNVSVDIATQVGVDIRTIRDTVSTIQQENKSNAQHIKTLFEYNEKHEIASNKKFEVIDSKIETLNEKWRDLP